MRCKIPRKILSLILAFPSGGYAAESCNNWVAKVLSAQGKVQVQSQIDLEQNWHTVKVATLICPGDMVRVTRLSRATLMLRNNAVVTLDQNTTLSLAAPDTKKMPPEWLMKLLEGVAFFRSRAPQHLTIETPFINAVHEGTEFTVSVDDSQAKIQVLDGEVKGVNNAGQIQIKKGFEGIAGRNVAPRVQALTIMPQDAVQWALYYPPLLDADAREPVLQQALNAYQQGDTVKAIALLDQAAQNPRGMLLKASILLDIGQLEAVKPLLQQLSGQPGQQSAVYALQSVIAVTQNQQQTALDFANQALNLEPQSVAALLALSYAQQSLLNLDAALAASQKATTVAPENALAWARLAELQLSSGDQRNALLSASKAQKLNPAIARTQIVLGFAHLAHTDLEAAQQAFAQALQLDSADPMVRLGLGLLHIRQGDLEQGRQELEAAVNLDPNNAMIRSYLGKAYYELKNKDYAGKEFEIAKTMDAKDPTPWLYDALLKLSTNRPVEALQDMQQSIALNPNRGVYRSKLLLDEDSAVRGANLGRIYDELGLDNVARLQANIALVTDPSNYTAHRLMADSYMNRPRQEFARASEMLQAQLLQPLNYNPIQPQLAYSDLNIPKSAGFADTTFNEYSRLYEGNQHRLTATGLYGSNDTRADEAVLSGIHNKFAYSLGQMHYQTNGFRPNADLKHDLYNAFVQYEFSPQLSLQAEYRHRETAQGDIRMQGSANNYDANFRRSLNQDTYRLGAKYSPTQHSDFLVSFVQADRGENLTQTVPIFGAASVFGKQSGYQLESQYLLHGDKFSLTLGGGTYQIKGDGTLQNDLGTFSLGQNNNHQSFAYAYTNINLAKNAVATVGLSYDNYLTELLGESLKIKHLSPKFGLQWRINDIFTLRLAGFQAVKAPIQASQSIQPMQIAGFNQFFDDVNGTRSTQYGIGVDSKLSPLFYVGAEAYRRELKVQAQNQMDTRREALYRLYANWSPYQLWQLNSELRFEDFRGQLLSFEPKKMQTAYLPLNMRFFNDVGFFADLGGQFVHQTVATEVQGQASFTSNFFLLDAAVGYRFPKRYGMISLEAKNLLDKNFKYQDRNFQMNEVRGSDLIPERLLFMRITFNF